VLHALAFSLTLAAASPANQTALATKLAEAIASERGFRTAKVYVGGLPPGAAITAPVPTFTLLGSVVETPPASGDASQWQPMAMRSTTLYYELPQNASDAIAAYMQRVTKAGWHENALMQRFAAEVPNGGFAITPRMPTMPHAYCAGGNKAMLAIERLRSMPSIAAITVASGPEAVAFCAMNAMANAMPSPPPSPPPLPTLRASQGVTMEPSDSAFHRLLNNSDAAITTSLPLSTVGADFAQQFTAGGWSADPPAQSATAYVQTFRTTIKGRHYQSVLSLISTGKADHYMASLEEHDVDATPRPEGFSFPF
jgi:hypothetical protein